MQSLGMGQGSTHGQSTGPPHGTPVPPMTHTLPETNIAPEMDGWNTSFLLGWPIFRGYVSFREGKALIRGY